MNALPGSARIRWRETPFLWAPIAWLAALAWPPLLITFALYPPQSLGLAIDGDWRLLTLAGAVLGVTGALELIRREWARGRRPSTRLGVIWRFVLYGAVLAVVLQLLLTLALMVMGWMHVTGLPQGLGVAEATFLVYGVLMLPLSAFVGAAYAVWAGLMVALIAFAPTPPPMRPPAHLLGDEDLTAPAD